MRPYTGNIGDYPASFPMPIEAPQAQEVRATGLAPFPRRSIVEYDLSPIAIGLVIAHCSKNKR